MYSMASSERPPSFIADSAPRVNGLSLKDDSHYGKKGSIFITGVRVLSCWL